MDVSFRQLRMARGFVLLVGLLAVAAGAKAILYDTLDPDLFWHLRVADELARQAIPHPLVDDLSYASISTPWTPYSWLADLGMREIWNLGGYQATVLAQSLMCAALVVLIAMIALELTMERFGHPRYLAASVAAFAGGFLSLPYLSFRPVTAALVILAVIVWLLVRDRRMREESRAVWLVVPLTALLINIHLYAVFAPAAVLGLLLGNWLSGRRLQRYARLFVATCAACLATPMLPGVIATAWHYQFDDEMVRGHVIAEMQPFYHGTMGWAAAGIAAVVLGAAVWKKRALSIGQWIWICGSTIVLLRLGRFAPIFGIFVAPTLAVTLPVLSDNLLAKRWTHAALTVALFLSLVRVAPAFPYPPATLSQWINRNEPASSGYPAAAVDFVQREISPRSHRMVSEFTWGGYLEWRMGEKWRVLMDGRTQVYPREFWEALYLKPQGDRQAYLAPLVAGADAAVLPSNGSQFKKSLLDLGWKIAYADQRAVVLIPPTTPRSSPHIAALDSASSETP